MMMQSPAYPSADVWASNPLTASREFDLTASTIKPVGPVAVEAAPNLTLRMSPKAVRAPHQWLLKKAHPSRRCGQPLRCSLQPLPCPRGPADDPGVALGVADRVWTIGDLLDAALALEPNRPIRTKRNFTVIEGGKN